MQYLITANNRPIVAITTTRYTIAGNDHVYILVGNAALAEQSLTRGDHFPNHVGSAAAYCFASDDSGASSPIADYVMRLLRVMRDEPFSSAARQQLSSYVAAIVLAQHDTSYPPPSEQFIIN
jgi:hypothetical protein